MIAIVSRKQQTLDGGPTERQQINFTGNLNRAESATVSFIIEEAKETILGYYYIIFLIEYQYKRTQYNTFTTQ